MKTYCGGTRNRAWQIAVLSLMTTFGMQVMADDAKPVEGKSLDCLQINQIKRTRIIDDQNIVFATNGNRFYNNHLAQKCSGLKSADKFRYKTSQSVLCNVDTITVLHDAGSGMMDGATCGLGTFTPAEDPDKKDKGGS